MSTVKHGMLSDTLNLEIITNEHFEDEQALINLDTAEVLLIGDLYHERIYSKIEGYIEALKHLGKIVNIEERTGVHEDFSVQDEDY